MNSLAEQCNPKQSNSLQNSLNSVDFHWLQLPVRLSMDIVFIKNNRLALDRVFTRLHFKEFSKTARKLETFLPF